MSRINELIGKYCPDGVEHATLSDLGQFIRGNGLQKADLSEQGFPAIHYGQIHTFYGTWTDITKSFTDPNRAAKLRKASPGDLLIATTSEDDAAVAKATAWVGDGEVAVSGDAYIFRHTLDPKYMSFFFQSEPFQVQKARFITGTKVRRISGDALAKIVIPVPPLEVQHEIAQALDQFAELEADLEAELEAELTARQFQYIHYRDSLFSYDGADCEWLTLNEAALDFGRGKSKHRPRNDPRLYGGPYPFIQTGDVRNSGHLIASYSQTYNDTGLAQSKLWPRGTICITIAANIAETGILNFNACFPDSVIGMVVNPKKTSQHFVEYLLQSHKADLAAKGRGSAQANINLATFEEERFPFPPLREQERIVSVLDKHDALVKDLSSGLAAEFRARRKQYEYYRDRLLTFQEATA